MAHIELNNETLPGILGLLDYAPHTGNALLQLAEVLLRGSSGLTAADREIIAASVSFWNNCNFCHSSHAAAAAALLNRGTDLFDDIKEGFVTTPVSEKLHALLAIAHKVQQSGKLVLKLDIERAKLAGATDNEIHDAILISAAFCMYNRYVDGLGTWAPTRDDEYIEMGIKLATTGYH